MDTSPIFRHERIALHFSGGRDSLACLYLLKPHWDRITVMWLNTGAALPETIEQMRLVQEMVPHFMEVNSNQPAQIEEKGPPSDLFSVWDSPLGRLIDSSRSPASRMQAPFDCCRANLWIPLNNATMELGATLIIRGQRNSDRLKSPIKSGSFVDGVEIWFPIEDWSTDDVNNYVGYLLPEHYQKTGTSLDCWNCTAYVTENAGKFEYMKEKHPALYQQNRQTLANIIKHVENELDNVRSLCL